MPIFRSAVRKVRNRLGASSDPNLLQNVKDAATSGGFRGIARAVKAARGTSPTSGEARSFGGTRFRPRKKVQRGGSSSPAGLARLINEVREETPADVSGVSRFRDGVEVPQGGGGPFGIGRARDEFLQRHPQATPPPDEVRNQLPSGGVSSPAGVARLINEARGTVPRPQTEAPQSTGGGPAAMIQRLRDTAFQRFQPRSTPRVEEAPQGGGRFSNAVQERLAQELTQRRTASPPQVEVPQAEAPEDLQQALLDRLSGIRGLGGSGGRFGGSFQEMMARTLQAQRQGPFMGSQVRNRLRSLSRGRVR